MLVVSMQERPVGKADIFCTAIINQLAWNLELGISFAVASILATTTLWFSAKASPTYA